VAEDRLVCEISDHAEVGGSRGSLDRGDDL